MREWTQSQIEISDVSYDVFYSFIEFIYTENVSKSQMNDIDFILELYSVADRYIMESLKSLCSKSLMKLINLKNVCYIADESYKRSIYDVKNKCVDFILKHFGKIIGLDEFIEFP